MMNNFTGTVFDSLTEKEKLDQDNLISEIDRIIGELVYDKDHLRKAYNYYNGEYDEDQFKHLEDIYGVDSPTTLEFIPLIRNHIDALVGEHLENELEPSVTCKDAETLSQINKDKQLKIYEEEVARIKNELNDNLFAFLYGQEKPPQTASEKQLAKLAQDIDRDFISEYEMSVFYVLKHLMQSKSVDLKNKLKLAFIDLLVAGQCYYKVSLKRKGETPDIQVLNPFDVFFRKSTNSPYVNTAQESVVRHWMTKTEVISKYGRFMDEDAISDIEDLFNTDNTSNHYYVRTCSGGLVANTGVTFNNNKHRDSQFKEADLIPVYEVERLSPNRIKLEDGSYDYRMDRYSGVRIGESIYVAMGLDEDIVRSIEAPLECTIKLNGISFDERGGKPYSLVLITAPLQDKYNLLHFYRDNLISTSGVRGGNLDVAQLPKFLGDDEFERIHKYIKYRKAGQSLVDTSQIGGSAGTVNTLYSGFDDTVPPDAIEAIQFAINQTAETMASVTGVFRERLGGIEQRDAVSNVKVGIKQSYLITKQYHQMMDTVTKHLLIDSVNVCKISYKDGMMGSIVLGNKLQKVFTIDPQKFSFTDYDIHLPDTGKFVENMQKVETIAMSLIESNSADVDIVLELVTSQSLTEAKENVIRSVQEKQATTQQLEQAAATVEQLEGQIKELSGQLSKTQNENETLKNKSNEIAARKVDLDYEINKDRNRIQEEIGKGKLKIDEERTEIEKMQLFDNSPYNNKVNFSKA